MEEQFIKQLYQAHVHTRHIPSPKAVCNVLNGLLKILFPELSDQHFMKYRAFHNYYQQLRLELNSILSKLQDLPHRPERVEDDFIARLPKIREELLKDATAIFEGDPAASTITEVIRTYPGFLALAIYRMAHEFWNLNVPLIPRILSEYAHSETGIEIHPGAQIGERFCIDHGTGLVIGETVIIGNDVKIYQGVTLGALSVAKDMAQTKRHPTIEDRVVIYANATILGGDTIIGHDSIIGGNVWITKSIDPCSRVYYQGQAKVF